MARRTDLKSPYGVADFKRILTEGYYYVDKTEYHFQFRGFDLHRLEEIPQ